MALVNHGNHFNGFRPLTIPIILCEVALKTIKWFHVYDRAEPQPKGWGG